jgi:hypothetical protein
MYLEQNNMTGTIPASLANMTQLVRLQLDRNRLTGFVPVLPFAQYTDLCCLEHSGRLPVPHFDCPLPPDADLCHCGDNHGGEIRCAPRPTAK